MRATIEGDAATADDQHTFADTGFPARLDLAQEVQSGHHPFKVLPRDVQLTALLGADGDKDSAEPLLHQARDGHLFPDGGFGLDL